MTQYATAKIGAILVAVNPAYRAGELRYVLQQSGSRLLISARTYKTSNYEEVVTSVREECPELEKVVFLESSQWDELIERGRSSSKEELVARGSQLHFDDPINIQYTSGTTGAPKGATLTHHGLMNNGFFVGQRCGYTESDRICVPVPYYHCFGMVVGNLAAITHGACVVLPQPTFQPAATLQAVQDEQCTSLYGVPTMFVAELALPEFASYDLSSLRTGVIAGAPCPLVLMQRVVSEMHLSEMTIAYGMTETSPIMTQSRPNDSLYRRTATVGTVHPHVEVAVVDPDIDQMVPRGVAGELRVRGYSVMRGYWGEPDATHRAIDDAGWMHTGDLATMDADGYVNIVGRIKDMIIRGGENIYPREIEDFLSAHPDLEDVHVVGVPDDVYGEEVMAWIKPRVGVHIAADELRNYCHGKIARYKIPRYMHFLGQDEYFPMTVTGKIQKNILRERAERILQRHQPLPS